MTLDKSVFLNDVPVTTMEENKLWSDDSSVMQEVGAVANAILAEDGKLTFAVHGAWGAGKTSFLRMVQDTVEEQMQEQSQEVTFCWYEASAYQGVGTPETTIALRIWNLLGGEKSGERYAGEAYEGLVEYMKGILADEFLELDRRERVKPYQLLQVLARRTGQLADFPRLLEEVLTFGGPDDRPKKLVLVVDDLDRCRSDLIASVLDVLQRFSSVENLFILIGVDRRVLLKAIKERYQEVLSVRDEHLALEKYIQYTIDLPKLTSDVLIRYIKECLRSEEDDDDEEIEKQVLDIIRDNAKYFVTGVRVKTPRAIKRSINAIRPALRMYSEQSPSSEEEQQLVIKEQLLAYNWRDFYQRYFQTAQQDYNARDFFQRLQVLCADMYARDQETTPEKQRDRRAIFDLKLDILKRRAFSEDIQLDVNDELARLLAMPPYWSFSDTEDTLVTKHSDKDYRPDVDIGGPSLDEEFLKLYLQSEQADAVGDARTSVEAAAQAYDLVKKNKSRFGKDISPRLGNLGVNAEKYKVPELAEAIFRLALEIDEYSGVLQQFASYILDNRPELYDEAGAILEKLQTPQHTHHKPWRTLQLLIQHKSQTNQEIEDDLIERLTEAAEGEANVRQLGVMLDALVRAGRYELSMELLGKSVNRFSDRNSRYTLQRMVADALARRPEEECEFIAMDLYRQIMANPETMDSGDRPNVMHNYATLLYKHDYDDEAGCLWFTAYKRYPSARRDSSIRRVYSMYLLRSDRQDLAHKVIEGEPIDEMALIPTDKALPEHFSDIDLPDALGEKGTSTTFSCLDHVS
jgi:hypothetical protein